VLALGTAADTGAEAMVAAVAKRAGEVGRAGRGSVLSAEADRTLAAIVDSLSEPKARCLDTWFCHAAAYAGLTHVGRKDKSCLPCPVCVSCKQECHLNIQAH
jgi:hypothetical protein